MNPTEKPMEFWIFVACAVLLIFIVPYIRLVSKDGTQYLAAWLF